MASAASAADSLEVPAVMTLREKQSLFVRLVGLLIQEAYDRGYELTFGEAWRTLEQARLNASRLGPGKGITNSLHIDRLAIDLNLFKEGIFLASTEDHRPLGEWWEKLHPLCRWGGRFNDGNHYSIEHEGRK
jgi:hypothetical protein